MKKHAIVFAGLVGLWSVQALAHTSSSGEKFSTSYNPGAAILSGGGTTIFLDSHCKAVSPDFNDGRWEWSNGGFIIKFPTKTFSFPRQELDIEDGGRCQEGAEVANAAPKSSSSKSSSFLDSTILFRPGIHDGDTSVKEYVDLIQRASLMDGSHPKAIGWSQAGNRHTLKLKVMSQVAVLTFDQDLSSQGKYSYLHPVKIGGEEMDPQMFFVWITYYKGMSDS